MERLIKAIKQNPTGWGLLIFIIVFVLLSFVWICLIPHPVSNFPDSLLPASELEPYFWYPHP